VQVFTANYSRTFRLADRPFPVKALDPAYIARSQQNAIRRLDPGALRPVLEKYLVTGEPWWETHVREVERIPGGRGVGLSKTRVGQQRFREAMLDRFGEACAFTGPQPPGALEAPTFTSTAQIPSTTSAGACFSDATCTHCSTGGSSPSTPAPGQSRSHQSSSAIRGSPRLTAGLSSCPRTCSHDSSTYKSMRRSLTRPGDNWLDKIRCPRDRDYPRWLLRSDTRRAPPSDPWHRPLSGPSIRARYLGHLPRLPSVGGIIRSSQGGERVLYALPLT
jgi:hypothetical protein